MEQIPFLIPSAGVAIITIIMLLFVFLYRTHKEYDKDLRMLRTLEQKILSKFLEYTYVEENMTVEDITVC